MLLSRAGQIPCKTWGERGAHHGVLANPWLPSAKLCQDGESATCPAKYFHSHGGERMSSVDSYRQYLQQSREELIQRKQQFEIDTAAVKAQRLQFGLEPSRMIMVGVGDSWFDYPIGPTDVLESIKRLSPNEPVIYKLAHYGTTTEDLLGQDRRENLIETLEEHKNDPIDAILFSGGGNDICGQQFRFWINDFIPGPIGDYDATLNLALFQHVLAIITAAYDDLIQIRNQHAPNAALLFHAYDKAYPSGHGACLNMVGPWLWPSLQARGWTDRAQGQTIVAQLIAHFQSVLVRLSPLNSNNYLVPTFGTLNKTQWENELHPSPDGFDRIAEKFLVTLRGIERFKNRI
jgi:lysophospholipase L1-like esterase